MADRSYACPHCDLIFEPDRIDLASTCPRCGQDLGEPQPRPVAEDQPQRHRVPPLSAQKPETSSPKPQDVATEPPDTVLSGWALAALLIGLPAILYPLLLAPIAAACATRGLVQIHNRPQIYGGRLAAWIGAGAAGLGILMRAIRGDAPL